MKSPPFVRHSSVVFYDIVAGAEGNEFDVRKIEDDVEGRVKGRTQKNNLGILGLSS
jgi:hypothetical protein